MKYAHTAFITAVCALLAAAGAQASDASSLAAAQNRLQALQQAGIPADNYNWAKAKCWLEAANTAQSENDRSGFAAQAQQEAEQLLSSLEADKNAAPRYGLQTGLSIRPDLQAKLKDLQNQHGTKCGAANLACAEVNLARAQHELNRMGPKAAAPYSSLAQCSADAAEKQVLACAAPVAPPSPRLEKITLGADALFQFDQSDLENILPQGRQKLDSLVQELKAWNRIESIRIIGHADRLGSAQYNQNLSRARAETVQAYLQAQHIQANKWAVDAKGATEPKTSAEQCVGKRANPKLVACLQPDRRIEIELEGFQ